MSGERAWSHSLVFKVSLGTPRGSVQPGEGRRAPVPRAKGQEVRSQHSRWVIRGDSLRRRVPSRPDRDGWRLREGLETGLSPLSPLPGSEATRIRRVAGSVVARGWAQKPSLVLLESRCNYRLWSSHCVPTPRKSLAAEEPESLRPMQAQLLARSTMAGSTTAPPARRTAFRTVPLGCNFCVQPQKIVRSMLGGLRRTLVSK